MATNQIDWTAPWWAVGPIYTHITTTNTTDTFRGLLKVDDGRTAQMAKCAEGFDPANYVRIDSLENFYISLLGPIQGYANFSPFRPMWPEFMGFWRGHRKDATVEMIEAMFNSDPNRIGMRNLKGVYLARLDMLTAPLVERESILWIGRSAETDASYNGFNSVRIYDRARDDGGIRLRPLDRAFDGYAPNGYCYRHNAYLLPEKTFPTVSVNDVDFAKIEADIREKIVDRYVPGCDCDDCMLVIPLGVDFFIEGLTRLGIIPDDYPGKATGQSKDYFGRVSRWIRGRIYEKRGARAQISEGDLHRPMWRPEPVFDPAAAMAEVMAMPDGPEKVEALTAVATKMQVVMVEQREKYSSDFTTLTKALHQEAINRNWCGEYERMMFDVNAKMTGDLRLPPIVRPASYRVQFRFVAQVPFTYTFDTQKLTEAPTEDDILKHIYRHMVGGTMPEGTTLDTNEEFISALVRHANADTTRRSDMKMVEDITFIRTPEMRR